MAAKVIYKYRLNLEGVNEFKWSALSRIIAIQPQDGYPTMWVEHPSDESFHTSITRKFWLAATGHPFDSTSADYLATLQLQGGRVVHVYEQFA